MKNLFPLLISIIILQGCASKRINVNLEGKQWGLVSVEEKPVSNSGSYIRFDKTAGKVSGKGGCNGFGGTYTATESNIRIEGNISTKMACDRLDTENAFFRALENTDRYTINNDTLLLYHGESLLATLKALPL